MLILFRFKSFLLSILFLFIYIYSVNFSYAGVLRLDNNQVLIGSIQNFTVPNDATTVTDVAQQYDVGYYELKEANPDVDLDHLKTGDELIIPGQRLLPRAPHHGIVINLAEMKLYYYVPKSQTVMMFPIGIGRTAWNTPEGITYILDKQKNPTWYVPQSIQDDLAAEGIESPKSIPPGPNNPLGIYMMRLAIKPYTYLIHGGNDPSSVGRRSSSGCIHLYNPDIKRLYLKTPLKMAVNIVNQPIKLDIDKNTNQIYLESHVPIDQTADDPILDLSDVITQLDSLTKNKQSLQEKINLDQVVEVAEAQRGIPTLISNSILSNTANTAKS